MAKPFLFKTDFSRLNSFFFTNQNQSKITYQPNVMTYILVVPLITGRVVTFLDTEYLWVNIYRAKYDTRLNLVLCARSGSRVIPYVTTSHGGKGKGEG